MTCDFDKHASAPIRKKRLSPTSKARREASQNQFVEKGGMPESITLEKSIVNRIVKEPSLGLRKEQNLIKCTPSRVETGQAGRENGIRLQKEE